MVTLGAGGRHHLQERPPRGPREPVLARAHRQQRHQCGVLSHHLRRHQVPQNPARLPLGVSGPPQQPLRVAGERQTEQKRVLPHAVPPLRGVRGGLPLLPLKTEQGVGPRRRREGHPLLESRPCRLLTRTPAPYFHPHRPVLLEGGPGHLKTRLRRRNQRRQRRAQRFLGHLGSPLQGLQPPEVANLAPPRNLRPGRPERDPQSPEIGLGPPPQSREGLNEVRRELWVCGGPLPDHGRRPALHQGGHPVLARRSVPWPALLPHHPRPRLQQRAGPLPVPSAVPHAGGVLQAPRQRRGLERMALEPEGEGDAGLAAHSAIMIMTPEQLMPVKRQPPVLVARLPGHRRGEKDLDLEI